VDRDRLGHRLDGKRCQLRGRNGPRSSSPGHGPWKEAVIGLRPILQTPRVPGLDVTIFNARLDPNHRALPARIAALLAVGVASMSPAFRNVL
jgi:hypothetical protein